MGDFIVFGELGLSGEVRSVLFAVDRIKEELRFGYKKAIVPRGSMVDLKGAEIFPVGLIREAIEFII